MNKTLLLLSLVVCVASVYNASNPSLGGFWRLNCHARPVYTGRVDSIVNPGGVAAHVHRVLGGSGFSTAQRTDTPMDVFNQTFNSGCSSCALQNVDNSNYWHPELYWMNRTTGELQVVSSDGAIIYYLSNGGAIPFPDGLRMLAGDTTRRSYNGSDLTNTAISYVCLRNNNNVPYNDNSTGFPTQYNFCDNLMRAQIWFPECWDGVNLDSPDHKSHMAYPIGGPRQPNCPSTHPVRVSGMFWELTYNTGYYPHGDGFQPFVWSNGDTTGYGSHGDFINGWNSTVLYQALHDNTCGTGQITDCDTLRPFVNDGISCPLQTPILTTEDVGLSTPINSLPGCNSLSYEGANIKPPCSTLPTMTHNSDYRRVQLRSVSHGGYATSPFDFQYGMIHVNQSAPILDSVWVWFNFSDGTIALRNNANNQYLGHWTGSAAFANGNPNQSPQGNSWYTFKAVDQGNGTTAFQSVRDNTWWNVNSDGTAQWNGYGTPTSTMLWVVETPTGGKANPLGDPMPSMTAPLQGSVPPQGLRSDAVRVFGILWIAALLLAL